MADYIQATNLRNGVKVEMDNDVWVVLSYTHRTPGNYHASMHARFRSLSSGVAKDFRFNSSDRIKLAEIDYHKMSYSYHDGHDYVFMDNATFEQISLNDEELGDAAKYLTEGMEIEVQYLRGKPIGIDIPVFVEIKVAHTEPTVRGDTATNVTKAAEMENGLEVQVPLFINAGDVLKIDTRDGSYVERLRKA